MEPQSRAPTALIGAYEPAPVRGGLRALAPLAGATLVEHQVRRALAAGARRVLLLVEEVPPQLADVLGGMRRDGVPVTAVAGLAAAADLLAPDEPVLLLADGCLAGAPLIGRLAMASTPAVAILADAAGLERHERIDARARWAGVAVLDARRVGDAAAMLGSWDPVSTLLRRAVQEGAARVPADDQPPLMALDAASVEAAEQAIVAAARAAPRDWLQRWLFLPIVDRLLARLLSRRLRADSPAVGAAGLALAAGVLALAGWRWGALLPLLATGPLAVAADRLARVGDRPARFGHPLHLARSSGAALFLAGIAGGVATATGQWGWWIVGGLGIAAAAVQRRCARALPGPSPLWLASPDMLGWVVLPLAVAARWDAGVVLACAYAVASAGAVGRRLVRRAEEGPLGGAQA